MARWVLLTVSGVLFLDTLLVSALAPQLPGLERELSLSGADTGLLSAAYAAGTVLATAAAFAGLVRLQGQRAMRVGMIVVAAGAILFAVGDSYWPLLVGRVIQGAGAAGCWAGGLAWVSVAAPPGSRGRFLGVAGAASAGGSLAGPVLGSAAVAGGRWVFAVVGLVGLVLTLASERSRGPEHEPQPAASDPAASHRGLPYALWLTTLYAMLGGGTTVLAALRLDDAGASNAAIGALFAVGAAAAIVAGPLAGWWADRRGRMEPVVVALVLAPPALVLVGAGAEVWLIGVGLLVTDVVGDLLFAPASTMVAEAGAGLTSAFLLNNLAWSAGNGIGAGGTGVLLDAVGALAPPVAMGALCLLTLSRSFGAGDRAAPAPSGGR